MKIIRKMFLLSKENGSEENYETARACTDICDRISFAIFKKYCKTLLEEPITYIVWAVWGVRNEGEIDDVQVGIKKLVVAEMQRVMELMKWESLSDEQMLTVLYIVRGYIISKITYMIKAYKAKSFESAMIGERSRISLSLLQPMGTA